MESREVRGWLPDFDKGPVTHSLVQSLYNTVVSTVAAERCLFGKNVTVTTRNGNRASGLRAGPKILGPRAEAGLMGRLIIICIIIALLLYY